MKNYHGLFLKLMPIVACFLLVFFAASFTSCDFLFGDNDADEKTIEETVDETIKEILLNLYKKNWTKRSNGFNVVLLANYRPPEPMYDRNAVVNEILAAVSEWPTGSELK